MEERDSNMPEAVPADNGAKRKCESVAAGPKKEAKKEKVPAPAPLVTLRNTRFVLGQRAVHWDRTMPVLKGRSACATICSRAAVLSFQSYLAEHADEALAQVPPQHLPVIASLAQERCALAAVEC